MNLLLLIITALLASAVAVFGAKPLGLAWRRVRLRKPGFHAARYLAAATLACANGPAGFHDGGVVNRYAEAAIASPHLLVTKGTADNQVTTCGISDCPQGSATEKVTTAGAILGVRVWSAVPGTVLAVASKAIAVGVPLYTAASGKVTDTLSTAQYFVGYSLTATTADGQEIEVAPAPPRKMNGPVLMGVIAATANTTVTAAQSGSVISNAGATGAVTFALPAATPGLFFDVLVEAAYELRLDPNGTETIALPSTGVQSAAGKYITADAVTEGLRLVCITSGTWDVLRYTGTWTAES